MVIKKIILTARQCFGGKWYEPGTYTRESFAKEAAGDAMRLDRLWDRFVYKAQRHADCPAITLESDKPPKAAPAPEVK